mmetsp:Transcript_52524/g.152996  ORF Transcript_52524/g.152996 Transcript_52524/m.152996 type:complete len:243 (+) Transcript_52524:795-1523(+)
MLGRGFRSLDLGANDGTLRNEALLRSLGRSDGMLQCDTHGRGLLGKPLTLAGDLLPLLLGVVMAVHAQVVHLPEILLHPGLLRFLLRHCLSDLQQLGQSRRSLAGHAEAFVHQLLVLRGQAPMQLVHWAALRRLECQALELGLGFDFLGAQLLVFPALPLAAGDVVPLGRRKLGAQALDLRREPSDVVTKLGVRRLYLLMVGVQRLYRGEAQHFPEEALLHVGDLGLHLDELLGRIRERVVI